MENKKQIKSVYLNSPMPTPLTQVISPSHPDRLDAIGKGAVEIELTAQGVIVTKNNESAFIPMTMVKVVHYV